MAALTPLPISGPDIAPSLRRGIEKYLLAEPQQNGWQGGRERERGWETANYGQKDLDPKEGVLSVAC